MKLATPEQYMTAVNNFEANREEYETKAVSTVHSFNEAGDLIAVARYEAGGEITKWAEEPLIMMAQGEGV